MKLVPTRPVTIHAVRHAPRWFPFMFRQPNGRLLLYIEHGYDRHFAPMHRHSSDDGGLTWKEEEENIPRTAWAYPFSDGELFEIEAYGFLDPKSKNTFCHYAAWSHPSDLNKPTGKEIARVHAPSSGAIPITKMQAHGGYPTFPWWPLFNGLHGKSELSGKEVLLGGSTFTSGLEFDGRLLAMGAMGYATVGRDSLYCFESRDRGHTWEEFSLVALGTENLTEGFNEASLVRLKDGRLYTVIRSGNFLFHVWSSDGGKTWTPPEQVRLVDSPIEPRTVWPVCKALEDGTLVMVYGRPGKHIIFDPSGTGRQWQGHLDLHAWELDTQSLMGVPPELRLHGPTEQGVRYWDSGDYLSLVPIGPREMLVAYDVQNYYETWNSVPIAGVRMVRVRLEE